MSTLLASTALDFNDYFSAVIGLLAGLGALLIGFKLLSDNMEKIASGGLKKMFSKVSKSKLAGVGIGAAATAIVQSSGATTVMIVGFVNVGIMSLYQATAMIMGANIGTTITAHIASLDGLDFGFSIDIVEIATAFTVVGIFMNMLCKKDSLKTIGLILGGLGLVFVGLEGMSASMKVFSEVEGVKDLLANIDNPFLLLLVGVISTALIQSSSATTSIVLTMANAGLMMGSNATGVIYFILGTNIGSCVTAMMSCIGANRNAVRTSVIHLMFNVLGAALFFILLNIWDIIVAPSNFMDMTIGAIFSNPGQQIAVFHTLFNLTCTALFLPFVGVFVKLSGLIVPEKKETVQKVTFMDKRMLSTPAIAIEQLGKERVRMADMSMENLAVALDSYLKRDESTTEAILAKNEEITALNREIADYLVQVSSGDISLHDEKIISALHKDIGDIERIAEIADNLTKYTRREIKHNMTFSAGVNEKVEEMFKKIQDLYAEVRKVLVNKDFNGLSAVDELENDVDVMRKQLVNDHIERLNAGQCKAENSSVFINLVCNLERVGDHLCFVAHSMEEV